MQVRRASDAQDSINDLLFGVRGVIAYGFLWSRWTAMREKRPKPLRRTTK